MLKVVHYINQFFANIGGEEKADYPVEDREAEDIGPGHAFKQAFGEELSHIHISEPTRLQLISNALFC